MPFLFAHDHRMCGWSRMVWGRGDLDFAFSLVVFDRLRISRAPTPSHYDAHAGCWGAKKKKCSMRSTVWYMKGGSHGALFFFRPSAFLYMFHKLIIFFWTRILYSTVQYSWNPWPFLIPIDFAIPDASLVHLGSLRPIWPLKKQSTKLKFSTESKTLSDRLEPSIESHRKPLKTSRSRRSRSVQRW